MTTSPAPFALIVGGSSGIGLATAARLRRRGLDLMIVARDLDKLAAARDLLAAHGSGLIETVAFDLADPMWVEAFTDRLNAEPRAIAKLVNAAGVFAPTCFLEHIGADFVRYRSLNRAILMITQAGDGGVMVGRN